MKISAFFVAAFLVSGVSAASAQEAVIIKLEKRVDVKIDAASSWQEAQEGQLLKTQSQVRTGPTGKVIIAFGETRSNIITIENNTETVIEQIKPGVVYLPKGRVFTLIRDLSQIENFEVKTPTAIAGARGTGWLTEFIGGETLISVFEDIVAVKTFDENGFESAQFDVRQDFSAAVSPDGNFEQPQPVSEELKQEWNKTAQEIIENVPGFDPGLVGRKPVDQGPKPPALAPGQVPPTAQTALKDPVSPLEMAKLLEAMKQSGQYSPADDMQPGDMMHKEIMANAEMIEKMSPEEREAYLAEMDQRQGFQGLPPGENMTHEPAFDRYMDQFRTDRPGPEGVYDYAADHYFGEFDRQWDSAGATFVKDPYDPLYDPLKDTIHDQPPMCQCPLDCSLTAAQCPPPPNCTACSSTCPQLCP